jgi:FtsH-binding integral membrane protein
LAAVLLFSFTVLPFAGVEDSEELWELPVFAIPGLAAAALGGVSCIALLCRRDWGRKGLLVAAAAGVVICTAGGAHEIAPHWAYSFDFALLDAGAILLGPAVMAAVFYVLWRYLTSERVRSAFRRNRGPDGSGPDSSS